MIALSQAETHTYTPARSCLLNAAKGVVASICQARQAGVDQLGKAVVLAHSQINGHVIQRVQEKAAAVCKGAVSTVLRAATVSGSSKEALQICQHAAAVHVLQPAAIAAVAAASKQIGHAAPELGWC